MNKKILVVDNHPLILKFMTKLLEKKGHEVRTAENGLAALDILETYIPDVIFIDLVMPHISGDKLCRIIRGMPRLRNVFIIILSAVAVEEVKNFTEFDADAFIAKGPFNKMTEHVLTALDRLDMETSIVLSREIAGSRSIHQQEIIKELLSSKRHSEVILKNLSEGILEITPEARVIYVNPSATVLTGIPEQKLLASNFIELFQGEDRERINNLIMMIGYEPRTIPDDSPVILNDKQVSIKVIPVKEEESTHIIVILEDITERKLLEKENVKTKKLESFGVIAGGIAHDFNNLLTAIMGNIYMAQRKVKSVDPVFKFLGEAEKAALRAKDLTDKFITFSTGGSPVIKPSSINVLL